MAEIGVLQVITLGLSGVNAVVLLRIAFLAGEFVGEFRQFKKATEETLHDLPCRAPGGICNREPANAGIVIGTQIGGQVPELAPAAR